MLLAGVPSDVREVYRETVLGPLLAAGPKSGPMLLDTLQAFLAHDCSWTRTADALHIHVNTVHYRVRRIELLTGRDLSRLDNRLDLSSTCRPPRSDASNSPTSRQPSCRATLLGLRSRSATVPVSAPSGSSATRRLFSRSATMSGSWCVWLRGGGGRQRGRRACHAPRAQHDPNERPWLLRPGNAAWARSDQMLAGDVMASRYYPRGVTAALWLNEAPARG
ncbi:PucR family transcriptional regulator [Streptomyces sp. NPDC008163]|uniref:PucR family transcriptional regulator n=1 Tax=Streptomyces sp. NPDC008163 TaxID=3364818 RepID=UPI0036EBFCE5